MRLAYILRYAFYASQTEDFIVDGDRVRLKNMTDPKESVELDDDGSPLAGAKAKIKATEFLKAILEQDEDVPVPLDNLYKKFCERFSHSVRQEVATNPKELLLFLKLNRNIFFIRSNKVSLVRIRLADENGSESERSTVSFVSNGTGRKGSNNSSELFSLTLDNVNKITLVKCLKTAQDVIRSLKTDIELQPLLDKFIAIDFKLIHLGDEILPSIIVIASSNRMSCFDMAHSDSILLESGLKEVLESDTIIKVVHDVKRVSGLLSRRYSVHMKNIFDTQIAHAIIQHLKFGKTFAELRGISFLNLQRVYNPESLMLSDVIPRRLSQSPNWTLRPITADLLLTACEECHCLVTSLYRIICAQLPQANRQLFDAKCHEALALPSSYPLNGHLLSANRPLKNGSLVAQNFPFKTQQQYAPLNGNFPNNNCFETVENLDSNSFMKNNNVCSDMNANNHSSSVLLPTSQHNPYFSPSRIEPPQQLTRVQHVPIVMKPPPKKMVTIGTQTISTGQITIHGVFEEATDENNKFECATNPIKLS